MTPALWDHWLSCRFAPKMCARCVGISKLMHAARRRCPLLTRTEQEPR